VGDRIENLTICGPTNRWGDSDTILEFELDLTQLAKYIKWWHHCATKQFTHYNIVSIYSLKLILSCLKYKVKIMLKVRFFIGFSVNWDLSVINFKFWREDLNEHDWNRLIQFLMWLQCGCAHDLNEHDWNHITIVVRYSYGLSNNIVVAIANTDRSLKP
jgi:hypothetical protein